MAISFQRMSDHHIDAMISKLMYQGPDRLRFMKPAPVSAAYVQEPTLPYFECDCGHDWFGEPGDTDNVCQECGEVAYTEDETEEVGTIEASAPEIRELDVPQRFMGMPVHDVEHMPEKDMLLITTIEVPDRLTPGQAIRLKKHKVPVDRLIDMGAS